MNEDGGIDTAQQPPKPWKSILKIVDNSYTYTLSKSALRVHFNSQTQVQGYDKESWDQWPRDCRDIASIGQLVGMSPRSAQHFMRKVEKRLRRRTVMPNWNGKLGFFQTIDSRDDAQLIALGLDTEDELADLIYSYSKHMKKAAAANLRMHLSLGVEEHKSCVLRDVAEQKVVENGKLLAEIEQLKAALKDCREKLNNCEHVPKETSGNLSTNDDDILNVRIEDSSFEIPTNEKEEEDEKELGAENSIFFTAERLRKRPAPLPKPVPSLEELHNVNRPSPLPLVSRPSIVSRNPTGTLLDRKLTLFTGYPIVTKYNPIRPSSSGHSLRRISATTDLPNLVSPVPLAPLRSVHFINQTQSLIHTSKNFLSEMRAWGTVQDRMELTKAIELLENALALPGSFTQGSFIDHFVSSLVKQLSELEEVKKIVDDEERRKRRKRASSERRDYERELERQRMEREENCMKEIEEERETIEVPRTNSRSKQFHRVLLREIPLSDDEIILAQPHTPKVLREYRRRKRVDTRRSPKSIDTPRLLDSSDDSNQEESVKSREADTEESEEKEEKIDGETEDCDDELPIECPRTGSPCFIDGSKSTSITLSQQLYTPHQTSIERSRTATPIRIAEDNLFETGRVQLTPKIYDGYQSDSDEDYIIVDELDEIELDGAGKEQGEVRECREEEEDGECGEMDETQRHESVEREEKLEGDTESPFRVLPAPEDLVPRSSWMCAFRFPF